MTKPPSMLCYALVQCTLLCILLACMFHWHKAQHWLIYHVGGSWELWRAIGFMLPAFAQCAFILFLHRIDILLYRQRHAMERHAE